MHMNGVCEVDAHALRLEARHREIPHAPSTVPIPDSRVVSMCGATGCTPLLPTSFQRKETWVSWTLLFHCSFTVARRPSPSIRNSPRCSQNACRFCRAEMVGSIDGIPRRAEFCKGLARRILQESWSPCLFQHVPREKTESPLFSRAATAPSAPTSKSPASSKVSVREKPASLELIHGAVMRFECDATSLSSSRRTISYALNKALAQQGFLLFAQPTIPSHA